MVQKKINLCFVYPEGDGWTGEINYLDSLISSLLLLKLNKLNFIIFCSYKKKKIPIFFYPEQKYYCICIFSKKFCIFGLEKNIKIYF